MNLEPFKELIRERCGLEFNGIAEKPLHDSILKRCAQDGERAAEGYFRRISTDENEFFELISLLTINETYFFREPEQIRFLVDTLVPRLLAGCAGRLPVQILSAGCSSGEEPYSLAIALREKYGAQAASQFAITAGDIDREALGRAGLGHYKEFSFRALPAELRARYFEPAEAKGTWKVKDEVRRMVGFHHLNLLAAGVPSGFPRFDAIFFRNVSIYFGLEKRRQIQGLFRQMLQPNGVLLLGSAETLANDLGVLSLVEEGGLFYFGAAAVKAAKQGAVRPADAACPAAVSQPAADHRADAAGRSSPAPAARRPPALAELVQMIREKRLAEAGRGLAELGASQPENHELQLLQAFLCLRQKDYPRAEAVARGVLDSQSWSVDACVILGLSAKWRGDNAQAMSWFKQAVYDRSACWPAHFYLAETSRASQAAEKARRAYRTVLQLIGGGEAVATGLQVIPLELPVAEVRFLCEHQLAKLDAENR